MQPLFGHLTRKNKVTEDARSINEMFPSLKHVSYKERVDRLKLPTLEEKRRKGKQMKIFKNKEITKV